MQKIIVFWVLCILRCSQSCTMDRLIRALGRVLSTDSLVVMGHEEKAKKDAQAGTCIGQEAQLLCQVDDSIVDSKAQLLLGIRHIKGIGVPQDVNYAFSLFQGAASHGNAMAQYHVGLCYDIGRGVSQDLERAVVNYKIAADQGSVHAQCNLGVCYALGKGVAKDPEHAFRLLCAAAMRGYWRAQINLALCYEYGIGTDIDLAQAKIWYAKAAEQEGDEVRGVLSALER